MSGNILSIDLGTTNVKTAVYDSSLRELGIESETVSYSSAGDFVEFDPEAYFQAIVRLILKAGAGGKQKNREDIAEICLTGQAESLVMLDRVGKPVCPGISWMDMRSRRECEELSAAFPADLCYSVTGQPELIPTWPITKILWMKRNRPEVFDRVSRFLLLKDYIVFRLCGTPLGDQSIYGFSHYFNVRKKCFFSEILRYCSVSEEQLPETAPSGSIAGKLLREFHTPEAGLTARTLINIGTLDHFAGMLGTGNVNAGAVNESAGTVLSLAVMAEENSLEKSGLPFYCGPFPESYVLLPVCESGGYSLEWYRKEFMPEISFARIDEGILSREGVTPPLFLPYLAGTNSPDFNRDASGVFFGFRGNHNSFDFARGVMEGVAYLLKMNLDYIEEAGIPVSRLISTGGGAKSNFWTQLKADITGKEILVPENTEACCLGAAMMGAVREGSFSSFREAADSCVRISRRYIPGEPGRYPESYRLFRNLYRSLGDLYRQSAAIRQHHDS